MPHAHTVFLPGEYVEIGQRDLLERFAPNVWEWEKPVTPEQLEYAGKHGWITKIEYWTMRPMYQLNDIPGWWHEDCLLDGGLRNADAVPASDVFAIDTCSFEGVEYVRIRERESGLMCLLTRVNNPERIAEEMQAIAKRRYAYSFESRYEFQSRILWPPVWEPEQQNLNT